MAETSLSKVEDALAAALAAHAALADHTVITDQPSDVALEDDQLPALVITTVAYRQEQSDEQGQTLHAAKIDVAAVHRGPALIIGRANYESLAHVIAAIHPDRTLGGRLHDLQENDLAPVDANKADAGAVSLQFDAIWFTRRGDWFTIVGQGGALF